MSVLRLQTLEPEIHPATAAAPSVTSSLTMCCAEMPQ